MIVDISIQLDFKILKLIMKLHNSSPGCMCAYFSVVLKLDVFLLQYKISAIFRVDFKISQEISQIVLHLHLCYQ